MSASFAAAGSLVVRLIDPGKFEDLELPLDVANPRQRLFRAVVVPRPFSSFEGPLQTDLPVMKREGVAPASIHLGIRGIGLCKPIALVSNRALEKGQNPSQARIFQLGGEARAVKGIVGGME